MRSEVEHEIAAVSADQHGVVSRPQLLDLGLSEAAIGRRLTAVGCELCIEACTSLVPSSRNEPP
jgi:hypothetical protein